MVNRASRTCVKVTAAAVVALWVAVPNVCLAQERRPLSVWTYSLYKTITYEVGAAVADIPLYYYVLGGASLAGAGVFTAVNLATSSGIYYAHEVAWNLYGPTMQESTETAVTVGVEKLVTYRVLSTASTFALAYAITGNPWTTASYVVLSGLAEATVYLANEYGWYAYGPPIAAPAEAVAKPVGAGPRPRVIPLRFSQD